MKFNNEFGFSVYSREYFLVKAALYYDHLCELEGEGFISIKRNNGDGKFITIIEMINEIAIKLVLTSDVSDAELLVNNMANWPASETELKKLLAVPLANYLSFQI